jgi:hypothetical protein
MTDNDISSYELELVRSAEMTQGALNGAIQYQQPQVVYTQPSGNGISNQMVIIVLALIIGVVAIAYSRNCNCGK